VPAGYQLDFLGTRYKTSFVTLLAPQQHDRYDSPSYPPFDEEYFEWIDLLEAVAAANGRFTMLELGAGFGRWTARGAAAAKQFGLPYTLIAVEAEPTHFEWMCQNLQDNGVKPEDCRLIHAAVTGKDGKIGFQVGDPVSNYGQSIGGSTEVNAISLPTLLQSLELVDLIDMDVQGAELEIIEAATEVLNEKVKRIHVETHSNPLHSDILTLFRVLGWEPHSLYAGCTADTTPWGRINFQGGIQSWLNPRLHQRAEISRVHTLRNSLGWRTVRLCRGVLDRFAPRGTLLRKLFNATLSGIGRKYSRDPEDILRRG
jgi:FkbM family methyltransferase